MGNESDGIVLARLEERMNTLIISNREQAKEQKEIARSLIDMGNRMVNVENSLSNSKPVIDEFITIKHKVVGAGQFGKWVWVTAATIIGFLLGAREHLISWLTKT